MEYNFHTFASQATLKFPVMTRMWEIASSWQSNAWYELDAPNTWIWNQFHTNWKWRNHQHMRSCCHKSLKLCNVCEHINHSSVNNISYHEQMFLKYIYQCVWFLVLRSWFCCKLALFMTISIMWYSELEVAWLVRNYSKCLSLHMYGWHNIMSVPWP